MPLSWNEIRDRATAFSREWKDETSEDAEAKSFWDAFFNIFGISRRRIATFETPVIKSDGHGGFIDLLWKGKLVVEHKSRGRDLDRAFQQAKDYFHGLEDRDLPQYVLVSDFARFRLYDLDRDETHEFALKDLPKNIRLFGFIAGYQTRSFGQQDPVNIQAAEKLGQLHDLLKDAGYRGHPLELFLVRVLFCLFAEDNAIFEPQQFREWIEQRTAQDGSDLGPALAHLFQVLNTPEDARAKNLDEHLAAFRYINGKLFLETIPLTSLDRRMREMILDCSSLDWSSISPAIFGALFQSIMDKVARRNLGAHYTSETNILKALQPLFLDSLHAEFQRVRRDSKRLIAFHEKLGNIRILDPACGCGNFLVIAYRELRLLELEVLRALYNSQDQHLDVSQIVNVDVDQFYGIELEEFPAQIAQVALWMTDHQMNQKVSEEFGQYFARLPLKKSPNITHGNALTLDWATIIAPKDLSYIVGNPPFIGKKEQTAQQKSEVLALFSGTKGSGVLDYVCCWYLAAVDYMATNRSIRTAFVSTNSITQGEQVGVLWPGLLQRGVSIEFAHRPFQWTNEAKGMAAVHCVIVGFSLSNQNEKQLYEYETIRSRPNAVTATHINPYLVDAVDAFIVRRTWPICADAPEMNYGSMPIDNGWLILSDNERRELLQEEPHARPYIRRYMGGEEFLNGIDRYCLWLVDIDPAMLRQLPRVSVRVAGNRKYRLSSDRQTTRNLARTPTLFGEIRQPNSTYLFVPKVSSELRRYLPIGFNKPSIIASGTALIVKEATKFHFGVLSSLMHSAWMRTVCGRMKSDYQYSAGIVYNNFPWPEPTPKQRAAIETAAQAVLDERARHPDSTLADLYDPLSMPPGLVKAHQTLDRAVDAAYGRTNFRTEAERVAFLFTLYERLTSLFPTEKKPARRGTRRRTT
ncbi:MAG: class I SAM-dependent DNA methyltransferase [Acidobacteriota bacterium]|nr:class I SAM-dependent DNA methyltransferase [Acidobacteriota bacterium]